MKIATLAWTRDALSLLGRRLGVRQLRPELADSLHRMVEALVVERPFVDQRVGRVPELGVRLGDVVPHLCLVDGVASAPSFL